MKRRLLWLSLLFFITTISVSLHAQNTITITSLGNSSPCPGSIFGVNFVGGYGNSSLYYVQLLDEGVYKDIPFSSTNFDSKSKIGFFFAFIPATQAAGVYSLRIGYKDPAAVSAPVSVTIKSNPSAPTVDAIQLDCQRRIANDASTYVYFKKLPNATAQIYDQNQNRIQQNAIYNSDQTNGYFSFPKGYAGTDNGYVYPVSETTYSISQVVDGCESGKSVTLLRMLYEPSGGPTPVNQTSAQAGVLNYCQGDKTYPLNVNGHSALPANYQVAYSYNNSSTTTPPTPDSSGPGSTQYTMQLVPIDVTKGCPSPIAANTYLYVNVNARPAKPIVPAGTVSLCQYQTPTSLSASVTISGATLLWYGKDATNGTGTATATQPSTSDVGTLNYYVSQKLNDCESARAKIVVEVTSCVPPRQSGVCESIKSGEWTDQTTWSCGRVPLVTDLISINDGHVVVINSALATAQTIRYYGNGRTLFSDTGTLSISGSN